MQCYENLSGHIGRNVSGVKHPMGAKRPGGKFGTKRLGLQMLMNDSNAPPPWRTRLNRANEIQAAEHQRFCSAWLCELVCPKSSF